MYTDTIDLSGDPHRRYNPLTAEWILVSPHRTQRPWQGQDHAPSQHVSQSYDSQCYLCPGNARMSGAINPHYDGPFVFDNDFAALKTDTPQHTPPSHPLLRTQAVRGLSRVMCYCPDHSQTLAQLDLPQIERIIDTWNAQIEQLGQTYLWVQVFENKGEMMGCSQPHPHAQIWANNFLPSEIAVKDIQLRNYFQQHQQNLILDYVLCELADGSRTVVETEHWLAVVPYWAAWPFETLLTPKVHISRFSALNPAQKADLALALQQLTIKYDNLFQCAHPYSMGWHYAPFFQHSSMPPTNFHDYWQLHALFYPPLLRSASVRKFMVGYEMFAEKQRDITAEQAADRLRRCAIKHYTSLS